MKRHFLSLLLLSSTSLFSMQPDFASRLSALRKRSYGETQAQPSVSAHEHGSSSQPRQLITCTRRQYTVPDFDEQTIAIIMEEFKVTKPIAQTLFHRGLKDRSSIAEFLNPSYDHAARHPSLLKDANKAVERIARALEPLLDENGEIMLDENGKIMREKILIVGDYDVDGMTSTALLINCLEPLGANIDYQCPHRINDGYGVRP